MSKSAKVRKFGSAEGKGATKINRPYLCTVCEKHDVIEGGYHVNIDHQYQMITMIAVLHGPQYDETHFAHHVCGRACYIQLQNTALDDVITAPVAINRRATA